MDEQEVNKLQQFRGSDPMVDFIFSTGKSLFAKPLDQWSPSELINIGGKLTGAYAYLAQKSAEARATHDTMTQQKEEEFNKIITMKLEEGEKITQARQIAKVETTKFERLIVTLKEKKNQWEGAVSACERMISFIQSAIKMKQSETFSAGKESNADEVF